MVDTLKPRISARLKCVYITKESLYFTKGITTIVLLNHDVLAVNDVNALAGG